MKIALVGTNWGRIHIGTFKKAGLSIELLVGRNLDKCRQIAKQSGIPRVSTDLDSLAEMDLIILASPANTHLDIIKKFPNKAIWCEKPVSLSQVDTSQLDFTQHKQCYINYAFPHLKSVQLVTQLISSGEIGRVQSVIIKSGFDLPGEKAFKDWFIDIIVHPFAYISHLFGAFDLKMAFQMPDHAHISSIFATQNIQMDISFYRSHEQSMLFDITFIGETGDLHLKGGYKPYSQWFFDPVKLNGKPQNSGEYSSDEDIWMQANAEAVRLYISMLNGQLTTTEAKEAGLFDLERAIKMEAPLLSLHGKSRTN